MKTLLTLTSFLAVCFLAHGHTSEHFTTNDGDTLYYSRIGNGNKVLILGGAGWEGKTMEYWVDSLQSEFECILLDARGTGKSSNALVDSSTINILNAAHDIEDLRKHLGVDKLSIVGISYGGGLAQTYAALYPEKTRNIVLVSPIGPDYSYDAPFTDNVMMRFYPHEKDSIEIWKQHPDKKLAHKNIMMLWLRPYFFDHELGKLAIENLVENYEFNLRVSYLMYKHLSEYYDIKSDLIHYKGSCTIIKPRQDPIPTQTSYQIKELLPQTKIIFIERCGHLPGIECPEVFFDKLRAVL